MDRCYWARHGQGRPGFEQGCCEGVPWFLLRLPRAGLRKIRLPRPTWVRCRARESSWKNESGECWCSMDLEIIALCGSQDETVYAHTSMDGGGDWSTDMGKFKIPDTQSRRTWCRCGARKSMEVAGVVGVASEKGASHNHAACFASWTRGAK